LLPEMAVRGGLLNNTELVARPLATPTPKRVIALVARSSTARLEEFQVLSDCIQERFGASIRISRGKRKGIRA